MSGMFFPVLRIKRLTVQLREIAIGDAVALASMPDSREQERITAFLRCVCEKIDADEALEDPANWTIQERQMAVCHYLASVLDDGPDFAVGAGRYSDYFDGATDKAFDPKPLPIGEFGGDTWAISHLTGVAAEVIERLDGELPITGRLHWLVGGMAAQLSRTDEPIPAGNGYEEWLLNRARVFLAFPESEFVRLLAAYETGRRDLAHLFDLQFADGGLVAMPVGGADLPPARFLVSAGFSDFALSMAGAPVEVGAQPRDLQSDAAPDGAGDAGESSA